MSEQKNQTGMTGKTGFPFAFANEFFKLAPGAGWPLEEMAARIQREFLTLWSHRAQAWINWPETACKCSDATELSQAQADFITAMQKDYAEYCDSLLQDALIQQDALDEEPDATKQANIQPLEKKAA